MLHPDVNKRGDATEETLRLVKAFEILSAEAKEYTDFYLGDPFAQRASSLLRRRACFSRHACAAEGPATAVFVNELRCQGRSCTSCCVDKAPEVFHFADDTGAARAEKHFSVSGGKEYVMRVAVGQCPTECIHWVTPRQRDILDAELLRYAPADVSPCFCAALSATPCARQSARGSGVAGRGGRTLRRAARARELRERPRPRSEENPHVVNAVRRLVLKYTHSFQQRK